MQGTWNQLCWPWSSRECTKSMYVANWWSSTLPKFHLLWALIYPEIVLMIPECSLNQWHILNERSNWLGVHDTAEGSYQTMRQTEVQRNVLSANPDYCNIWLWCMEYRHGFGTTEDKGVCGVHLEYKKAVAQRQRDIIRGEMSTYFAHVGKWGPPYEEVKQTWYHFQSNLK